jgi:hypothetical protein
MNSSQSPSQTTDKPRARAAIKTRANAIAKGSPRDAISNAGVKDLIAQIEGVEPDGEMYDA